MHKGPAIPGGVDLESITMSPYNVLPVISKGPSTSLNAGQRTQLPSHPRAQSLTGGGRMHKGPAIPGGVDLESITMSPYIQQKHRIYSPSLAKVHLSNGHGDAESGASLNLAKRSTPSCCLNEPERESKATGSVDLESITVYTAFLPGYIPTQAQQRNRQ